MADVMQRVPCWHHISKLPTTERWIEIAVLVMLVSAWRWFMGHEFRKRIAKLEERAASSMDGGVIVHGDVHVAHNHYNASDGRHHAQIEGIGQIVSPLPIVHEVLEHIGLSESWEAVLTKPDGTVERYGSDQHS